MKTNIKVGDIMTRDFESVSTNTSLIDCARKMIKRKVGSLVVHENNRLSGLLTERDIVYAVAKKPRDLDKIKARDVRRRKIATIKPSADVYDALQKMRKTKYRWIPVLVNKNVIGFLTLKDILKIEPTLFDAVQEIGQIREEQAKIKRVRNTEQGKSWAREGLCEECGGYGLLYNQDGRLICENCFERM